MVRQALEKGKGFFIRFTLVQDRHKQIALVRIFDVEAGRINTLPGEVEKQPSHLHWKRQILSFHSRRRNRAGIFSFDEYRKANN